MTLRLSSCLHKFLVLLGYLHTLATWLGLVTRDEPRLDEEREIGLSAPSTSTVQNEEGASAREVPNKPDHDRSLSPHDSRTSQAGYQAPNKPDQDPSPPLHDAQNEKNGDEIPVITNLLDTDGSEKAWFLEIEPGKDTWSGSLDRYRWIKHVVVAPSWSSLPIPSDECPLIRPGKPLFVTPSAHDGIIYSTGASIQPPPYPQSTFTICIIARKNETSRLWKEAREGSKQYEHVGHHRIILTLVDDDAVDGYICVGSDLIASSLPGNGKPLVAVAVDPTVPESIKSRKGLGWSICVADAAPSIVARIIYRAMAKRKRGTCN